MHEGAVLEMTKNELQNIGPAVKRGLMGSWKSLLGSQGTPIYILGRVSVHNEKERK